MIFILIAASLLLSACGQKQEEAVAEEGGPAKVEHLEGAEPTRVTLTEDAAKRLDIQTVAVRDTDGQMERSEWSSPMLRSCTIRRAIPGCTRAPNP